MKTRFYRPELDALRFFAFVCVFLHHTSATKRWMLTVGRMGAFGMQIFFLLSAYLIVTLLLREREATGSVDLKSFAMRRILRIWPLYFLVLFVGYGLGKTDPTIQLPLSAVAAFSVLAGNVYVLSHGWNLGVVSPLWSLSVEEQFYLAIPLLTRLGGRTGLLRICLLTILIAYSELLYLALHGASPMLRIWANSFFQFQFFAAGGLIALWSENNKVRLGTTSRGILLSAGILMWALAVHVFALGSLLSVHAWQIMTGYPVVLAATVAIFFSVLDLERAIPSIFIYLGKISYGLYLFHSLFLWFVQDVLVRVPGLGFLGTYGLLESVAFVLTVLTAMVSYRFFEAPILRYKHRFETIRTRAV